ncbi:MAG: ABC transporter substrate-binding protein [Spirochaetaceae bacterium]|jgi:peptide/nickel transport system substrate-binding protein|nr:ABC transporter substrate-binding protein [Spirochaetaceae bacterium]
MKTSLPLIGGFCLLIAFTSCTPSEELSPEAIDALSPGGLEEILAKTITKPWQGEEFIPGRVAGTWYDVMHEDPKSFNALMAEQDSATKAVVESMLDYLVEYDVVKREWKPRCAAFEIAVDEAAGTLDLTYTLRDDLYWSYYNSEVKIPVTSDDVIFWYNEIDGDPAFSSSGYNGQFLVMEDGTEAHIDIKKIDDKRFVFHFPRIVAEPLLTTNGPIAPRLDYEEAKRERGVQGVLDLFSVDGDPQKIPSMGMWFLTEYTPGQRLVYKRNRDYWNKDRNGLAIPYVEEQIIRIIPDENTQFLLFKEGQIESYTARPEDLEELINKSGVDYTVFNAEGSLSASFWTFNQNPKHRDSPHYGWFTQKEFRQAMSCLLNRDRIASQVYRGLAEPKLNFFPEPNPYYNPEIKLRYLYDPGRALELLESIGMKRDGSGTLRDDRERPVTFDLTIQSGSTISTDIASIIMAELSQVGITVNIRVVDFQKMVEQMFTTFEWQSMLMRLSGSNIFPTQGSNVWPSDGNLHLWYPLQESPATEWEARIDYLYNEGAYTLDRDKARMFWNEYQEIILEQCPVIYLLRPRSFSALRNRWDLSNVYYDNLHGFETTHIFLKP